MIFGEIDTILKIKLMISIHKNCGTVQGFCATISGAPKKEFENFREIMTRFW